MHRPAGWSVYGHIQSLPIPVCCPHMLQDGHHCSCTKEGKGNWTKWLSPRSTYFCHHEVLWETSQGSYHLYLTCQPRPTSICLPHDRSTDYAIAITLHTALSHLDKRNTYVRMLFIDYSSAFSTIVPSKLITKAQDPGSEYLPLQLDPGLPVGPPPGWWG